MIACAWHVPRHCDSHTTYGAYSPPTRTVGWEPTLSHIYAQVSERAMNDALSCHGSMLACTSLGHMIGFGAIQGLAARGVL